MQPVIKDMFQFVMQGNPGTAGQPGQAGLPGEPGERGERGDPGDDGQPGQSVSACALLSISIVKAFRPAPSLGTIWFAW